MSTTKACASARGSPNFLEPLSQPNFDDRLTRDAQPTGLTIKRLDYGPGYRVYYIQQGSVLIVLLAGGNKSTQERDIRAAKALARDL